MSGVLTFSASPFDRAAHLRDDAAWIEAQLGSDHSRFLPFWRSKPLVLADRSRGLAWARRDVCERVGKTIRPIFLGTDLEVAHFALDVSELERPEAELGVTDVASFEDARSAAAWLSAEHTAVVAMARSLLEWHRSHGFCSACGQPSRIESSGWVRRCDACDRQHFPRTDPVVIAAVIREDRCLLGRQPGWPPGLFSALAGFVEPGETIEAAVRREVFEEAGIQVGDVRYFAAQPWPFPHSLMLGCIAEASSDVISLNDNELAEARWFSRDELRAALDSGPGRGSFFLPSPVAIAHHLIAEFLRAD